MVASTLAAGQGLDASCGQTVIADKKLSHCGCLPTCSLALKSDRKRLEVAADSHVIGSWKWPCSPSHRHAAGSEAARCRSSIFNILPLQGAPSSLKHESDIASVDMHISMIKEGKETKSYESALLVHLQICAAGLDDLETVSNQLVLMYAECGSISGARQAFDKIASPTEHAWTFLMQAYVACGNPKTALSVFQNMQQDFSVTPSKFTYVSGLKACAKTENLQKGQIIHAEVVAKGIEDDGFIGNMLVDFYTKCNSSSEAADSFKTLPIKDAVSWNALLGGYAENGLNEEVIELSFQMYHNGVTYDAITYASIIKACRNAGAVCKGLEIHFEVAMDGFDADELVCSSLVEMYAKHNFLSEACDVFDTLSYHDVVVWTSLIGGYVEGGFAEDALRFLEQMHLEGISPDAVTFSLFLKACNTTQELDKVYELHTSILKAGFDSDSYVNNSLVASYFGCSKVEVALDLFDNRLERDVTAWNTVLTANIDQGNAEEALNCWERMRCTQILVDEITLICVLKACSLTAALHIGREVHEIAVEEGFENDSSVANVLMDMYGKCESLADAREVFEEMPCRSVVSWTTLMSGLMENRHCMDALTCLQNMQQDGILPNNVTFVCSLKACTKEGKMHEGQALHMEIVLRGFDRDIEIGNVLIDMYANFGLINEAQHIFNKQEVNDVVSWNALISGYVQCGLNEEASNCFQQMHQMHVFPDRVTWNAVITAYAEQEAYENMFNVYEQMQEQGFLPDVVTYTGIFKACGSTGALEAGQRIHARLYHTSDSSLIPPTAVIDMYGKCGSTVAVHGLLDFVLDKDAVAWNALLAVYARAGDYEVVTACYETMLKKHIKPDGFSFLSILIVCSHAGLVQKGQLYYREFRDNIGVTANTEHHNTLLDLHGRAGQINEALSILDLCHVESNLVSWNMVLDSFQKWGDLELYTCPFNWPLISSKDHFSTGVQHRTWP